MRIVREKTLTMLRFRLLPPRFRTGADHITGKDKATSLKRLDDAEVSERSMTATGEPVTLT